MKHSSNIGVESLVLRVLKYTWAGPWTLFGSSVGLLGLLFKGHVQVRQGTLEFYGGLITWLLNHFPICPMAMTLGHSIWGIHPAALDIAREHEQVHVRQYERWGPFFIPAYLLCSFVLWLKGRDGYRENPFEVEAFKCGPYPADDA